MSETTDPAEDQRFGAAFDRVDEDAWMSLVDAVLRGRDFDRVLVTDLGGGVSRRPLYTSTKGDASLPGEWPFVRGSSAAASDWDMRQRHRADVPGVNAAILEDLEGGMSSIQLDLRSVTKSVDLARILRNVQVDIAPVSLLGANAEHATQLLAQLRDAWVAASDFIIFVGLDPLGAMAGGWSAPSLDEAASLTADFADGHPGVRFMAVDTAPYVEAGAADSDELAYAASTGVAYLKALVGAGIEIDHACELVEFRFSASSDQFATIAKLRAARRIWSRIVTASGGSPEAAMQYQHVTTSPLMFSQADPWVNLLRACVGSFGAVLGGAQAVTTLPFDHAVGLPDELARRSARNIQLLLAEESHLGQVIDPSGGSYYIESLTDDMAAAAWTRFQILEAGGGMAAALDSGLVLEQVEDAWKVTHEAVATRRAPLTGVSEFPDIEQAPLDRPPAGEPTGGLLPRRRLSQPFEALRARASEIGSPSIFLANLGPVTTHSARAAFAKNLFEVGGIAAIDNDGFDSPVAEGAAFADANTPLAVICSSDEVYEKRAASTATALKEAGAARVYLAGKPGEHEDAWRSAGVDGFIYMGCDIIAVIEDALSAF